MRTQWIIIGGIAAAATTAAIVYAVRKRRHAAVEPETQDPFDIVEAELIEVEAIPVMGISAVDPGPITQTAGEGIDLDAPVPRRY